MSKRFVKKEYSYDWWFVFDKKQEYCEDMKIPFYDVDNLIAMSEEQVVDLLNEQKEYQQKVKETLQKRYAQLDRITKRYGSMHKPCKDLLAEICKELGVEIDD